MSKAPEEGEIWEWRVFGRISQSLENRIKLHPFRLDQNGFPLANIIGQDLYLISPVSENNIKLRKSFGSDWMLKFKLLLRTEARLIELYQESEKKSFRFPIAPSVVREAAQLLNITLSSSQWADGKISDEKFLAIFTETTPPVLQVRVGKIRSQYQFADGWVELADVTLPQTRTQSLSLHAFRREAVEAMLDELPLTDELEVMNYLAACRRWA